MGVLNIKNVVLKKNAVIIADVHYKKNSDEFINLLKQWILSPPPQVFFLGDIFHLLLPFEYLKKYNALAIELINRLAEITEVYYTPGNHDFNIEDIFPHAVFADAFYDRQKDIFLTHGDLTGFDKKYLFYAKFIRNPFTERFFHLLSFNFLNGWLFKKILTKRIKCSRIKNFKKIIKKKLKLFDYGIIIEGHYHQNVIYDIDGKKYINLPAFICTKSYILLKLDKPIVKEIYYDGR